MCPTRSYMMWPLDIPLPYYRRLSTLVTIFPHYIELLSISVKEQKLLPRLQCLCTSWTLSPTRSPSPHRASHDWFFLSPHSGFSSGVNLSEWSFLTMSYKVATYITLFSYHFPFVWFMVLVTVWNYFFIYLFIYSLLHYNASFIKTRNTLVLFANIFLLYKIAPGA